MRVCLLEPYRGEQLNETSFAHLQARARAFYGEGVAIVRSRDAWDRALGRTGGSFDAYCSYMVSGRVGQNPAYEEFLVTNLDVGGATGKIVTGCLARDKPVRFYSTEQGIGPRVVTCTVQNPLARFYRYILTLEG